MAEGRSRCASSVFLGLREGRGRTEMDTGFVRLCMSMDRSDRSACGEKKEKT